MCPYLTHPYCGYLEFTRFVNMIYLETQNHPKTQKLLVAMTGNCLITIRGMETNPMCTLYKEALEDIHRIVRDCGKAKNVWNALKAKGGTMRS